MKFIILLCCALLLSIGSLAQSTSDRALIAKAEKLIVVTTPDWNSVTGQLTRYQKSHGKWKQLGAPVPIVVGKNGMAWDPSFTTGGASVKREGDGRSPAGVYSISETFGFGPSLGSEKNYLMLTPATECVDDVNSSHYAHIVSNEQVAKDWNSSEHMRSIENYRFGAIVPYNMSNTKTGAGSCIFLHIWSGPGKGTAGCTAMPEQNIKDIVSWIQSKGSTVLVQMPAPEYERLKKSLGTP